MARLTVQPEGTPAPAQALANELAPLLSAHDPGDLVGVLGVALAESIKLFVEMNQPDIDEQTKLAAAVALWDHVSKGANRVFAEEGTEWIHLVDTPPQN